MKAKQLVLVAAFQFVVAAGAAQADPIRIGTEGGYRPWNFVNDKGELDGFEIDLAKTLCKRMNAECTFLQNSWDGLVPGLDAGRYDVLFSGFAMTAARAEKVDMAGPYATLAMAFYTVADSPLANVEAKPPVSFDRDPAAAEAAIAEMRKHLSGQSIGVSASGLSARFVETYFKDAADVRQYRRLDEIDIDVASGRVAAGLTQLSYATEMIGRNKDVSYKLIGPAFEGGMLGQGVGALVAKGNHEMQAKFQTAIDAAIADGTVRDLSHKWFNADMTPVR
ncbi:transporter substrate-binding domain-containing protein [Mesorhizobium sp. SP-1A]|uniref:transporter substrate-binding domain-containing protein n=1 Tax=Mesorhizobium sp. SP-1A TaxID=3077840 RepID=UPI0028F71D15|nr:transporter substrate-binding domain-containing protein [Mesorhizobium sp. SP-1A]